MTILNNILAVSWHEFRVMCTRYSILLVLSGGIFVYGLLYNVSIRPRACFFPLFSFLPLWLHYNLNPLCVQY